jgi:hypothetical protein
MRPRLASAIVTTLILQNPENFEICTFFKNGLEVRRGVATVIGQFEERPQRALENPKGGNP